MILDDLTKHIIGAEVQLASLWIKPLPASVILIDPKGFFIDCDYALLCTAEFATR